MAYNVPGRTVVHFTADTVIELSKIPNVIAIKDAGGNLGDMSRIIEETEDFQLYSGDDGMTLPVLSIGGTGIVSVASHVIGNEMQQMVTAYKQGRVTEAARLHRKLLPVMDELFKAPSPAPVKTALQFKGLDVGSVRLPLLPLNHQRQESLSQVMNISL